MNVGDIFADGHSALRVNKSVVALLLSSRLVCSVMDHILLVGLGL